MSALLAFLLAAAPPAYSPELNARVFDRAWSLVERRYWNRAAVAGAWEEARARFRPRALAATGEQGLYRVLGEMLATLGDSHVFAEDPTSVRAEAARTDGGRAGFGFASWQAPDGWRVFAVDAGSPAAAAGVQVGWRLVSVNGRDLDPDFHPEPGETADLVFEDETSAKHALRIAGGLLPPARPRSADQLANGVLLLRLDSFDDHPERWIAGEIAAAAPRAVILDLRENYGGEAIAVARVAGRFFGKKQTLLRQVRRSGPLDVPALGVGSGSFAGPLAVLVGPRTASGAEAIAAAVEESGRGITVGERTAGALTGAARYDLPDGGVVSVAEVDIRTPDDARLEGRGFTPHYVVAPALAELRAGRDPILARALALLAADAR